MRAFAWGAVALLCVAATPAWAGVPGPVILVPADGSYVATTTPGIGGVALPHHLVTVIDADDEVVCTDTADAAGAWTCVPDDPWTDGTYQLRAYVTDASSDDSPHYGPVTFHVKTSLPSRPAFLSPAAGSYTNQVTPLMSGTAEPESVVFVMQAGSEVCAATAAPGAGAWSCRPIAPFGEGSQVVSAYAVDRAGNRSPLPDVDIIFNVDLSVPDAPMIAKPVEGADLVFVSLADSLPSQGIQGTADAEIVRVDVYLDGVAICAPASLVAGAWNCPLPAMLPPGSHVAVAVGIDAATNASLPSKPLHFKVDNSAPVVLEPADQTFTNAAKPMIRGRAHALGMVEVYVGNNPSTAALHCAVPVAADGSWACEEDLAEGNYNVYVRALDSYGTVVPVVAEVFNLTVDRTAPALPGMDYPTNQSWIRDHAPLFRGRTEAFATVHVEIYGFTAGSCVAVADAGGSWRCRPATTLPEGTYNVFWKAVDRAGNESVRPFKTIHIDLKPPNPPTIGFPSQGLWTQDNQPAFLGSAGLDEAVTVDVYLNGVRLCAGINAVKTAGPPPVDTSNWTCALPGSPGGLLTNPLADGMYRLVAVATDWAGNVSPEAAVIFHVDAIDPEVPTIEVPAEDGFVNVLNHPTASGTAEAESFVEVRMQGDPTVRCSDTASLSGTWSCAHGLPAGTYGVTLFATSTDSAGNSTDSDPRSFSVDTDAPAAPVVTFPGALDFIADQTPLIEGTAEPHATVAVYVSGAQVCSGAADSSGAWSCRPTAPLAEGQRSLRAIATDRAGNSSPQSTLRVFTIDVTTPDAPLVILPLNGSHSDNPELLVLGTAERRGFVQVYIDGAPACDDTVGALLPTWSCRPANLADGVHTIYARVTDRAGNVSEPSPPKTFTIDTVPPEAPVITWPTEGSFVSGLQPLLQGHGEANSRIRVYRAGRILPICAADAGPDGQWGCAPTTPLTEDLHFIHAASIDEAGNRSADSALVSFTVDITPPAAPFIAQPLEGSIIGETMPLLEGSSEPHSTVVVNLGLATLCEATTDLNGDWSCLPDFPLVDGTHFVTAIAISRAGNVSLPTEEYVFTVHTQRPEAPTVLAPADGSLVATTLPLISGSAGVGHTVDVYVDGGLACGALPVNGSGGWSCPLTTALTEGRHTALAIARDVAGNESLPSAAVAFRVVLQPPAAPVITTPEEGYALDTVTPRFAGHAQAGALVTVRTPWNEVLCEVSADPAGVWECLSAVLTEGAHVVEAIAADGAGNVSLPSAPLTFAVDLTAPATPAVTAPADGTFTNEAAPQIIGTAEPLALVEVSLDGALACSAIVDSAGDWSCRPTEALAEGEHLLEAIAIDAAGNVSDISDLIRFTVHFAAPNAAVIAEPTAGAWLSNPLPRIAGTADAGLTVDVSVDGVVRCADVSVLGGSWSCDLLDPLLEGSHVALALARDAAGNLAAPSLPVHFQVVTSSPGAPAISAPVDGSQLRDTLPLFRGAAEALGRVQVKDDHGNTICEADVDPAGRWACAPAQPLQEGSHGVVAISIDRAGNASLASARVAFTVDVSAPTAPRILAPVEGSVTNDPMPRIEGSAEALAKVEVEIDGALACSAAADAAGAWACRPGEPLSEQSHRVVAFSTDAAGNRSEASLGVTVVVDRAAPNAPVITQPVAGAWTQENLPTVSGHADPQSEVEVRIDDTFACSAVADGSGRWSCASGIALSDGLHVAVALALSPAGNGSAPSAPVAFTVATLAPDAPTFTAPAEGAVLGTQAPLLSGNAPAGSTVEVYVGGVPACIASVNGDGTWRCGAVALGEGAHRASAVARDLAGNVSAFSAERGFTVKTVSPAAPVIDAPVAGSRIAEVAPLIQGSAEVNSVVTVFLDGSPACTAATQAGAWSCRPEAALAEGSYLLNASATDLAGNVSSRSAAISFEVVLSAPEVPAITSPVAGSYTKDPAPVLAGTSQAGLRIELRIDGAFACDTVADGSGSWVCGGVALADGAHTAIAIAVDDLGKRSQPSAPVLFHVSTTPPEAPAITSPEQDEALAEAQPAFTGTAPAGASVQVLDDLDRSVCFGAANGSGVWTCVPEVALAEGRHTVHAIAVDLAGNASLASEPVSFTVKTTAPEVPVVLSPAHGARSSQRTPLVQGAAEPEHRILVEVDGALACEAWSDFDGNWECRVQRALDEGTHELSAVAVDAAGNHSEASAPVLFYVDLSAPNTPEITTPQNGSSTLDATPWFGGKAMSEHEVRVYVNGEPSCSTLADKQGNWRCRPAVALAEGTHTAVAISVDRAGNASEPSPAVVFHYSRSLPLSPVVTTPADGGLINQTEVDFRGTAAAGLRVEVRVDGALVCTAVANEGEGWQCLSSVTLRDGSHVAQAVARSEHGVASEPSAPVRFTIDTAAPEAPLFNPPDGRRRPTTFDGTAEPGTVVWVFVDGDETCSSPVAEDGNWSCTAPVSGGNHRAVAVAIDDAGNESPEAERRFKVIQAEKVGGGGSGCSAGTSGGSVGWALPLVGLLFFLRRRFGRAGEAERPEAPVSARVKAGEEPVPLPAPRAISPEAAKQQRSVRASSRTVGAALACLIALLLVSGEARAQTQLPGFELDKLVLNPGARDSLILGSGDLLREGAYRLAVSGHYQHDPLVFYTADGDRFGRVVGSRAGLHLSGAYGITQYLEAGLQLPLILGQSGDEAEGIAPVATGTGIGTPFLHLRFGPLQEERGSVLDLAFSLGVGIPLGAEDMLAREDGWMVVPQLEAGKVVSSWLRIGSRVGMAFRPSQTIVPLEGEEGTELGHQVLAGLVLSTLGDGLRAEAGGQLDIPVTADGRGGGELWGGLRYPLANMVEVYGLAGPGFGNSLGTPSFRGVVGIALGPQQSSTVARRMRDADEPDAEALRRVREAGFAEGQEAGRLAGLEKGRQEGAASCQTCAPPSPAKVEPGLRERVYFAFGESVLSPEAESVLARLAGMLRREPGVDRVIVEGHADPTGAENFNRELSRARAEVVRDRLVAMGVDKRRIEVQAHGVERALASNSTEEGRTFNRRTEVIVILGGSRTQAPVPVSSR